MFRASVSAGRWLGVAVRVHMTLPALLLVAGAASVLTTGAATRGVGLWCALLLALLTREIARGIALLWYGMPPRTVILLPFGGVVAVAQGTRWPGASARPGASAKPAARSGTGGRESPPEHPMRGLTLAPLLANFGAALLLFGFSYAVAPGVSLLAQPWISLHHLLRSAVWTQLMIGAINLLPAAALPSRQLLRTRSGLPSLSARHAGPAFALGNGLGLALMLAGFVLMNLWFVLLGCLALLSTQLRTAGGDLPTVEEAGALPVCEVMLTDFAMLSNAAILSEALQTTAPGVRGQKTTAQDVYPVVQGDLLVGAITRDAMARSLRAEGDGYVQRAMLRRLPLAEPSETLSDALRRSAALGAGEFVPVAEGARVLGILTPASLAAALDKRRERSSGAQPAASSLATIPAERASLEDTPHP